MSSTTAELRRLAVVNGSSDDGGGIENSGTLTITDSVLSDNRASGNGGGGVNLRGDLTLRGCELRGNSAQFGGGLFSEATLTMSDSIVSGNAASNGGGVSSSATFTATGSLISDNTAGVSGGGIDAEGGTLTIENVELSGNTAGTSGGGLRSAGWLRMTNSTVSGNAAEDGCGGGMLVVGGTDVTNSTVSGNSASGERGCGGGMSFAGRNLLGQDLHVNHVTVADNSATWRGSAIFMDPNPIAPFYPLEIRNSIVQGNCAATFSWTGSSRDNNVESPGDSCGFDPATNQVNVDLEDLALGPLQGNGGPTATHALGQTSVAADVIPAAACEVNEDQRGVARPQGAACDAGAFERDP